MKSNPLHLKMKSTKPEITRQKLLEASATLFKLIKAKDSMSRIQEVPLGWLCADEIAKRLEKMLPPGVRDDEGQIPPEVQTQLQQMSEALQVLGQRLQEAESKQDLEQSKLGIERYKAETDRMTAVAPAMGPEEIQAIVLRTLQDLMMPNELPAMEGFANGPTGQPEPEFATI